MIIKGQFSEWLKVIAGVPQGSILGPLLFLIYIDDIVQNIESEIFLFADDTSILETISDPILSFEKINRDLTKLDIWSKQWLVNFNPSKTKYIVFSKKLIKEKYPDLFIGGEKLTQVKTHKQLGVIFTDRMTFDEHVNENCTKAMKRLTPLKRLGSKMPRKGRMSVYISFIHPVLEYGFQLYDNSSKTILDKLESVQRQALLFVTRAYKNTSNRELLKEAGVPSLESRRKSQKIQFIYKSRHNLLPTYLLEIIPNKLFDPNNIQTRNPDMMIIPKSNKNYYLKSFIPSSLKLWNDTSIDIRRALSLQSLKAKLSDLYGSSSYHLYLSEDGNGAVQHSRIRMGLSGLNGHRKKYNFIVNGSCPSCHSKSEDPIHYFLDCPSYVAQRQQLMHGLSQNVPNTVQPYIQDVNKIKNKKKFTEILIYGRSNLDVDYEVFKYVRIYIDETKRFT